MSVYTAIDRVELAAFLAHYDQGELEHYEGITSGIENTNYFVTTSRGEFVLTLFEQHTAGELPFFLDLTAYLSEHDIPCAHPVPDERGRYLGRLKGKPAALVQRLDGCSIDLPRPAHCRAVGQVLGRLHQAGRGFPQRRDNDRGPHWWRQTAEALYGHIAPEDEALIRDELAFQRRHRHDALPQGIIHADLFRDNVLFEDTQLSGLIDFYYACTDVLLYDVAITVNDWCSADDGGLDPPRAQALLQAYQSVRPLSGAELERWPVMLRAAALRFWLSRLRDKTFPRPGELTHIKDPEVFKRILLSRRDTAPLSPPETEPAKHHPRQRP